MKMRYSVLVPMLAVVIATCSLNPAVGQRSFIKPDEVNNAALIYWQSFALLPELDEEQMKKLNGLEVDIWSAEPNLSPEEGKELLAIMKKSEDSVRLLDLISEDTPCDWGIVFTGPGTHLPHMGKARLLAKILQLSGEKALLMGMQDLAAQRFAQALRLGRHLGNDALILQLVGEKIEEYVVTTVTRQIDAAPDASNYNLLAKGLAERIKNLPARPTVADAYRNEKKSFYSWIEKVLLGSDEVSAEELKAAEDALQATGWATFLKASPVADRQRAMEDLKKHYDELIAFCEDHNADMETRLAEWDEKIENTRSFSLLWLPSTQPIIGARQASQAWQEFEAKLQQAAR